MAFLPRLIELFQSQKESQPELPAGSIAADDPRIAEGQNIVMDFWNRIGRIDEEVIGYDPDTKDIGTPFWPSQREEYHAVHLADGWILTTDGLSDPFVGTDCYDSSGLGLEFYFETIAQNSESRLDPEELPEMEVLQQIAYNAVAHGRFRELIDELGVLSMTLPMYGEFGERWEDEDGNTGFLFWIPSERQNWQVTLPFGLVRFVAVTPLLPEELSYAAESGANRQALANALSQTREGHRFDPNRPALQLPNIM